MEENPTTASKKIKMGDEQQGKPKRYCFEVAVDAALMEDALSGNLGQATTEFLNGITFMDKKGNPLKSSSHVNLTTQSP